jgi:hypothetical protein
VRRLTASVILLLVVSCTNGPEPSPRPTPSPVLIEGLPPLLTALGRLAQRYADGKLETLTSLDKGGVALVVSDPRGGVLFQGVKPLEGMIFRLMDGKRSTVKTNASLQDALVIDGAPSLVFSTCVDRPNSEPEGYVYVMDLESGRTRRLTDACRAEFFVSRVSVGGDTVVTTASSDLTEAFNYVTTDGRELADLPNPTDELPYNEPPRLLEAVLSPDGTELAYLEGPDSSGIAGDLKLIGGWVLVVLDQETGEERLRLKLAPPADELGFVHLDFDGRWAVVSQALSRPIRVIDTQSDQPREIKLRNVKGTASFEDRSG